MKNIFIWLMILSATLQSSVQNNDADNAKAVLKKYKEAVVKLDVTGTEKLFTTDSKFINLVAAKALMHII